MIDPTAAMTPGHGGRARTQFPGLLQRRPATPRPGQIVLAASAAGYPLTQLAIRRLGRRGAVIVELVCSGLLVRDVALIALGTPRRLRRGPATLLWLETGAALAATALGLRPVVDPGALRLARERRATGIEVARRAAVRTLFGLHTARYRIYLRPDRGRRVAVGAPGPDAGI